jgi:peroxiredoxin Q/BCP
MAQLRQDHDKYTARDTEIVVVGPEGAKAFADYWQRQNLPFIGLPDPKHTVLKLYGQQVKLFKFGRMPAQVIIDMDGIVRYVHYGKDMSDIPSNEELFSLIDELASNREDDPRT